MRFQRAAAPAQLDLIRTAFAAAVVSLLPVRYARARSGSAWSITTCGRSLSVTSTLPFRPPGWPGRNSACSPETCECCWEEDGWTQSSRSVGWSPVLACCRIVTVNLWIIPSVVVWLISCCVVFRDYGDQYGELGELDGSNNSSDLLSQSSGQPESPLPPQSSLDLDRRGKHVGWNLEAKVGYKADLLVKSHKAGFKDILSFYIQTTWQKRQWEPFFTLCPVCSPFTHIPSCITCVRFHCVQWIDFFYFLFFYIMLCFASFMFYFLAFCMSVVVSAHACLHVCGCLCVHAHLLTSRGGGPSSPQTNPPLSLKAVTRVQAGRRQQTGPAGKEEVELTNVLVNKKFELCFFKFHLPLIFVKNCIGK